MAQIDSILVDIDAFHKNAQVCKELILERLEKDNVITKDQKQDYTEKWQIIVVKPTWFESWMKKFGKGKKEDYEYKLVKFED